ncbi:MAG: hypothetical protein SFU99_22620 [Saprospiraceae bacterium]|nr:hypothetical protein [Saprospiraceae bacterium]
MKSLTRILSHGLVAGLIATVIGLYLEYNYFQTPNGTQIIYKEAEKNGSASPELIDSITNSINFFKLSESVSFLIQSDGILKTTKKHRPFFQKEYDEVYSKTHINSIFGFEIFYSPIIFTKQLKIITNTSNGKFYDIFDIDSKFSEAAFSSFVDNVLKRQNRTISIIKKEKNTQTHLIICVIGFMLFLFFWISRAINNFVDTIFKGLEALFK